MKLAPLFAIALAACGGPSKPVKASNQAFDVTTYYIGTVEVSGPDGTPYGPPTETVLERTTFPMRHVIVETVLIEGKMAATTLTQTEVENVFAATVEGDLFTGTLTYQGPAWGWTGWDYDITLADGGKITGHADIDEQEIITEKHYAGPDGRVQAIIREHARAVTEDEYVAKRDELTAPPPAEAEGEHFYYEGTTTQWTGDGQTKLDTLPLLVERIVSAAEGRITEISTVGRFSGTRTYTETDVENVLTISDEDGEIGAATCEGPGWAWTACDYELNTSAGREIGRVTLGADTITSSAHTEVNYQTAALFEVELHAVTEEAFLAKRKAQTAE